MRANLIERLFLRLGAAVTDRDVRKLDAAIDQTAKLKGIRTRQRMLPWGTITNFTGGSGGGYVSPEFQPSVEPSGDGFFLSWKRGFIGGVEPTIGDVPISGDPATGEIPRFFVSRQSFEAASEVLVYFRLELNNPGFFIERIEPFADTVAPGAVAWRADKLALILFSDGTHWRAAKGNLGYQSINRRVATGLAQHLFWWK